MESLTPYLLVAVLAVVIYVSFFKSTEPAIGDKDSSLLIDELRRKPHGMRLTSNSPKPSKAMNGPSINSVRTIGKRRGTPPLVTNAISLSSRSPFLR
ncbi:MAG: hypothetical protein EBU04_01195 [Verrucomicrobia bacterium]|nr:hypothetical protein [Verrucomicrobiota bacterium]